MKYLMKSDIVQNWKNLRLVLADAGFAETDSSWRQERVCSPYSRIYYIPKGKGVLCLKGQEIPLREGYIYLIPAGLLYDYRCDDYMEQLYFHINVLLPNGMDLFYGCEGIYEKKAPPGRLVKALDWYRSQQLEASFYLQGMIWEELGDFLEPAGVSQEGCKRYSDLVEQFFRLAQNPVSVQNQVRCLAEQLHVSESTLTKRFRRETGMSPRVYLEQLVIQKACRLLIESNKTSAQVAEELGFSDPLYFSKYFKRQMHQPPSRYRRQFRQSFVSQWK